MMRYLNDSTWPSHGVSACAMKIRTSVLNRFWRDHFSDKYGLRSDMVPRATLCFATTVMD